MQHSGCLLVAVVSARKDVPESEGLIASACHDGAAVGTHGEVKDSVGVTYQGGNFVHCWIFPDIDLVVTVAMGADKLVQSFAEHEIAHLRTHINCLDSGTS